MSSAKVEKSNLVAKNADKKTESKFTIRCCDLVILCLSFLFTISVACSTLFYINSNQQQNAVEIEKIVERILDSRNLKSAPSEPQNYDRKNGHLHGSQDDDYLRKKRAVHDFRSQLNGETCE